MGLRPYVLTALLLVTCREVPAGDAPAPAAPPQSEGQLTVEGSGFVLRLADGRTLNGLELEGAILHLDLGKGVPSPVRLASILPDPDDPDILRHHFEQLVSEGQWKPFCAANAEDERWGFPISLPAGHPGREGRITLTCASGAVAKCVQFGYKPWKPGPKGEDLQPLHAACVRMVRADYCGDGRAHTRDGTLIQIYDDLDIQRRGPAANEDFAFEAGWTAQGAACVAHPRWYDLGSTETLRAQCPRLTALPDCNETTARAAGARLFNRSVAQ